MSIGLHNSDLARSADSIIRGSTWKDVSTIAITPTRGEIPAKVAFHWRGLMSPMNGKFHWFHVIGHEVGIAYNQAIESILAEPNLSQWKYILTIEDDNLPPIDGLLKLIETMESLEPEFAAVSGLYWTKGYGGAPMIYGNPREMPLSFRPQPPIPNQVQECNGIGMGFALWKMSVFRDPKITKPWFKTEQSVTPGVGVKAYTQDLWMCEKARAVGYKFAVDNRVLVGHMDREGDGFVW